MSESIVNAALLKAIEEMSHKLFVPATVIAIHIDYTTPTFRNFNFSCFWLEYVISFLMGAALSIILLVLFWTLDSKFRIPVAEDKALTFSNLVAVFLLPLPLTCFFPQSFGIELLPLPIASSIACVFWGFTLLSEHKIIDWWPVTK